MSDNTTLPSGTGGDTVRTIDKAGKKTQVITLDVGGSGAENLVAGTVPVSGTVGVTGVATSANQTTELASLASIDGKITAVNTGAVVVSSSALPSGASTDTKQDTGNTSVASIDTKTPALGQALAASSVPVVLTALQLSAITPPAAITGYALEAGHLAAIDTSTAKIPSLGQALAASSVPVVLTAIQQAALTPPAAITNYALETGGNLASVKTNTDPLVTAAAGGYVRQDSTATIAKESGGNLATIAAAVKGEDTAAADADKGIPALAVRQDAPTSDTGSGDYGWLKQDLRGRLWVGNDLEEPMVQKQGEIMLAILTELRVMNHLLQTGLNVRDDLDVLRQDDYFNDSLQ